MKPVSRKKPAAVFVAASASASSSCFDLRDLREAVKEIRNSPYDLSELSKALSASVLENKKKNLINAAKRFKKVIDEMKSGVEKRMERDRMARFIRYKLSLPKISDDRKKFAIKLWDENERMQAKFNRMRRSEMRETLLAERIKFKEEFIKFKAETYG